MNYCDLPERTSLISTSMICKKAYYEKSVVTKFTIWLYLSFPFTGLRPQRVMMCDEMWYTSIFRELFSPFHLGTAFSQIERYFFSVVENCVLNDDGHCILYRYLTKV